MSTFNLTSRGYAQCVRILKRVLGHYSAAASPGTSNNSSNNGSANAAVNPGVTLARGVGSSGDNSVDGIAHDHGVTPTTVADSDAAPASAAATAAAATDIAPATLPLAASPSQPSSTAPAAPPALPIPLVLLGGGGYHPLDTPRAFLAMTAAACDVRLNEQISENDEFYTHYLPVGCTTHTQAHAPELLVDRNSRAYLQSLIDHVRTMCAAYDRERDER
jgi:hypothetical protein